MQRTRKLLWGAGVASQTAAIAAAASNLKELDRLTRDYRAGTLGQDTDDTAGA